MPGPIYVWLRGKYVHFYVAQANVNARRSYASAYTARQCSLAMMVTPSLAKTPSHALTGCGRESLCNVNVQLILLLLAVDCGAVELLIVELLKLLKKDEWTTLKRITPKPNTPVIHATICRAGRKGAANRVECGQRSYLLVSSKVKLSSTI